VTALSARLSKQLAIRVVLERAELPAGAIADRGQLFVVVVGEGPGPKDDRRPAGSGRSSFANKSDGTASDQRDFLHPAFSLRSTACRESSNTPIAYRFNGNRRGKDKRPRAKTSSHATDQNDQSTKRGKPTSGLPRLGPEASSHEKTREQPTCQVI
jgi:hypothetical protein